MTNQAESAEDLSRLAWTEPRLPHGKDMRWISRAALSQDGRTGYAQARFMSVHPFVQDGTLLRPAILELLAQAAAATVSLQASASSGRAAPVKEGMLVAMRQLVILRPVLAETDILLCVQLDKTFGPFTSARLQARRGGGDNAPLAYATMTFFIKTES